MLSGLCTLVVSALDSEIQCSYKKLHSYKNDSRYNTQHMKSAHAMLMGRGPHNAHERLHVLSTFESALRTKAALLESVETVPRASEDGETEESA